MISQEASRLMVPALFLVLSVLLAVKRLFRLPFPPGSYTGYLWTFFLFLTLKEYWNFTAAIWLLALLSFVALKEYFTLIDVRLQDRWGIAGAYLSIPFMIYFIQIDWYGMFIISIPVYAFLAIPFLVAMGGRETEGTVFSIGAIDFGLFLIVYCIGHIGYLALFSTWKAAALILTVCVNDLMAYLIGRGQSPSLKRAVYRYLAAAPCVVVISVSLSDWAGIPLKHACILGLMIPALAGMGRYTISYIEDDLGVDRHALTPGSGQILDNLKSFLYVAPVAFHYIRYYLT